MASWRRVLGVLVTATVLTAVAGAIAVPAHASRAPTSGEREALLKAIRLEFRVEYRDQIRISNIRRSTRGPYAKAYVSAKADAPDADFIQPTTALFKRDHKNRWHFTAATSSDDYPCSVPPAVRRDLRLAPYCRR